MFRHMGSPPPIKYVRGMPPLSCYTGKDPSKLGCNIIYAPRSCEAWGCISLVPIFNTLAICVNLIYGFSNFTTYTQMSNPSLDGFGLDSIFNRPNVVNGGSIGWQTGDVIISPKASLALVGQQAYSNGSFVVGAGASPGRISKYYQTI
jgi:hypothetical protein